MRSQEASLSIPGAEFMKSGEFARLCHTTKETLRHYRQIGLLEPAFVSKSGYACYSPLQVSDFLLITSLRKAGSPLDAIKALLDDPKEEELDSILESHVAMLKQERQALLEQQRFLESTLARRRSIGSWAQNAEGWRVVELEEAPFADIDVSRLFSDFAADPAEVQELTEGLIGHSKACLVRGDAREVQGCCRVGLSALRAGRPQEDLHLCTPLFPAKRRRSGRALEGVLEHARPKGTYFQRLRTLSIDSLVVDESNQFDAYVEHYEEALRLGFEPIGDLYEQELSLYAGDVSAKFHTELSIRIAPLPELD